MIDDVEIYKKSINQKSGKAEIASVLKYAARYETDTIDFRVSQWLIVFLSRICLNEKPTPKNDLSASIIRISA